MSDWYDHARDRPGSPVQRALAEIWCAVLNVEHVGIHDDFLRIGGDSVLIMQAVARARQRGLRIEPRDFFRARTIAALEALVRIAAEPNGGSTTGDRAGPPLVQAQRRYLAPSRRHPHHHNRSALKGFPEPVDVAAIGSILDSLVHHHDALRTQFKRDSNGRWHQEIVGPDDTPSVRLDVVELAGLAPADVAAKRQQHATAAQEGFRLDRPPLLHAVLFRGLGPVADLLVVAHRLVADTVSMRILLEDLHTGYAAERAGRPAVPARTASFHQWATRVALDDEVGGASSGTPRSADPGPASGTVGDPPKRSYLTIVVDEARTGMVVTRVQATVPEVLLACLGHALARVLGATERVVEGELPGRDNVDDLDLSRTVGCGNHVVGLRLPADAGDLTVGLAGIRQQLAARPGPGVSTTIGPSVGFSYLGRLTTGADARWQWRPRLGVDTSPWDQHPLSTVAYISRGQLVIELEHRTDSYPRTTVRDLAAALKAAIDALAEGPGGGSHPESAKVQALTAEPGPTDRPDTTDAWRSYNDTAMLFPDTGGLVSWLDRAMVAHADRPAVKGSDRMLSYGELAVRSDAVTAFLEASGVRAGAAVAVTASRSTASYVGILGVLKAGCAYVPINPADPVERLEFVLSDSNVDAVLALGHEVDVLSRACTGVDVRGTLADYAVTDDSWVHCGLPEWPRLSARRRKASGRRLVVDPNRASYVIYTSGTTGWPKGVRIGERSVINFVHWVVGRHEIAAHDRVAQRASLTFDPSVQQIFPAWVSGACVIPVPERELLDAEAMLRWLRSERITHLDLTTSHWLLLLEAAERRPSLGRLPDLRWVILGGETAHYEQTHRWYEAVSSPVLLDYIYGPTEATVNATCVVADPTATTGQAPVGTPLPNYRVYVVDEWDALCPPGVVGEIVIGGDGIAQRYQSAEATALAFSVLSLPDGESLRVYRTRDLGQLAPTGSGRWTLEFKGRRDTQVKVRGFRVDLAEIEAVAATCPRVRSASVLVRDRLAQLVCCYTADPGLTSGVLRDFLASRLAAYQMPNLFVRMDSFALTSNGKLDTESLRRDLAAALAAREPEGPAPNGPLEQAIAAAWSAALQIGRVASDEDFFTIGGTSLLAMMVVSRLREAGIPAAPDDVLTNSTIAKLAAALRNRTDKETDEDRAPYGLPRRM